MQVDKWNTKYSLSEKVGISFSYPSHRSCCHCRMARQSVLPRAGSLTLTTGKNAPDPPLAARWFLRVTGPYGSSALLTVYFWLPSIPFLVAASFHTSQRHGRRDSGRRRLHCAARERCWRRARGSAAGSYCRPVYEGVVVRLYSGACFCGVGCQRGRVSAAKPVCSGRIVSDERCRPRAFGAVWAG